nr:reverse transcriptase domain-containing protein [Tanacetum cinerariifolium]
MAECLALADLDASINLMPLSVWNKLSLPNLYSMCITLELDDCSISHPVGVAEDVFVKVEVDAFLALKNDPTSLEVDQSYVDSEGEILLLEAFLNDDPSLPPPNQRNYMPEVHKELKICEAKSNKSSIDEPLEGIDPEFCTHKILMEEDFELAVQHQRRVNPKIHDIIKQEVLKLLDAGLIYLISNSTWVSPVHCVPKKGGFTVVENKETELIPTSLVIGWHVCIDYCKLNEATRKDRFPLPFMDQMLERLARNQYYCFLDGFSGYFQIPIDPKDQEKTTFTCLYGTFAYPRMHFGLCNAPGTFQRCMMAIFHDMIGKTMCEDTNLYLNWQKSHFMVKEGIVLAHKISKEGIEVDKAKVDVIAKLPDLTTVKGIRSFLGHAGFYRRKLTEAPISIALDWDMSFELMCDAGDFAIGAVLGQRQDKHFRPIHYASKIMTEAESNYTTTKKEMLAVVAENLAADHLSRLENPHQNVLDPKEINESFPLETLNLVSTRGNSSTLWFADFANYHAGNFVVKSSEGVYTARNPLTFLRLATMDPPGDTMAQITQPRRYSWILKTHAKGFCPSVFTSSASFGNHISKSNRTNVYLLAYLINGIRFM